jgi:twitching motility protein PilT
MEMIELLQRGIDAKASDILLTVGVPPVLRVNGELTKMQLEKLSPKDVQHLVYSVLTERQVKLLEDHRELDFTYDVPGLSRFRVNVHFQRNSVAATIRTIPRQVPSFEDLNLPRQIIELCKLERGFVLVTGRSTSGKSTTLAAMINYINNERKTHVITIEDPIEFLHTHNKSVVEQREVGIDTATFAVALKYALRQNPDVILIGEMRDLETIAAAVTAAETGHLVLATLHTLSAAQTIDRIIDVFPADQQEQIRFQLAFTLEGIISQQLLPSTDGGLVPACELLFVTPAVRNLIRGGHTNQINVLIETGSKFGMQSMDQAVLNLYKAGKISNSVLVSRVSDPDKIRGLI